MMPHNKKPSAGFTLLELLLAITIFAVMATTVYGVLWRTLDGKARAEERAELFAAGRDAVMRMADDLERALAPGVASRGAVWFIGVPGNDAVPTDQVGFVIDTKRDRSVGGRRGGRTFVSYLLEPMPDVPRAFALLRHEEILLDPLAQATSESSAVNESATSALTSDVYLVDRVAGLRLRYLDPATGSWLNSWDTTVPVQPGQTPVGLPPVVEIQLFLFDNSGGYVEFSTRVDLLLYVPPPTPGPGGAVLG
ncbi:MAG: prepilin-type N-terminal cleavage/methylation domain-containing protein [Candidatus Binatia bacterium]|nr:prepilin-type N-terminal cleavage/methylation domain-containing protein [Candidatus Binatia bacterium]